MRDFTLLRSERAFLRWYADVDSRPWKPGKPADWDDAEEYAEARRNYNKRNAEWLRSARTDAPTSYPVLATAVVRDWGMEWMRPAYVYPEDARRLLNATAEASS